MLVIIFMLTLYRAEINLVVLRWLQLAVSRGQMSRDLSVIILHKIAPMSSSKCFLSAKAWSGPESVL